MNEYTKLSNSEVKDLQRYVILERLVAQFVKECNIPFSAYYNALYQRKIKTETYTKIKTKLDEYANKN